MQDNAVAPPKEEHFFPVLFCMRGEQQVKMWPWMTSSKAQVRAALSMKMLTLNASPHLHLAHRQLQSPGMQHMSELQLAAPSGAHGPFRGVTLVSLQRHPQMKSNRPVHCFHLHDLDNLKCLELPTCLMSVHHLKTCKQKSNIFEVNNRFHSG
jgi:hypothetical protein